MPNFQTNQQAQVPQNDPYAMLNRHLSNIIPDLFYRPPTPQVQQQPDQPQQPQTPTIPTPAPQGAPQPGPQDHQRLLQAMSLQALLGQLASPFGGQAPMGFYTHPDQYASQFGMLTQDPNIAAMFNRNNMYKNGMQNRVMNPGIQFPQQSMGVQGGPQAFIDPNILAQAAAIINAIVQSGGVM